MFLQMLESDFDLSPLTYALDVRVPLEDLFYEFVLDEFREPEHDTFYPLTETPCKDTYSWSADDDAKLRKLVRQHGPCWHFVSSHFRGRSHSAHRELGVLRPPAAADSR